ncbi:ABC transporter permease [Desulfovibrio aerotolerans]|uniref:ABC transporter permease n=2 Tax=Desulfovibrionaceae TaxID=194924 RepID=A0A7K3NLQ7_9BACT|nr:MULTISPECIES: ABC transporter permease [Desulfovibrionaceae]MYL85167.1 ABC transporter permease [Solidesulfovibrio aerotolerans]NDY57134.1 ABC transporter permease [Desulfolutivibrio sulfodismutans]QLA12645.1 FtsX-like permease family protein [Desulfolutivibrio sulfodismutans DSM 3696]
MNLAVRDIRHNLGRFLLTCLGLSLLLGLVLSMIGIYRGLVEEALSLSRTPGADLWVVEAGKRGPFAESSRIPGDTREVIASLSQVVETGSVTYQSVEAMHNGYKLRLYVVGYESGRLGGPASILAGRYMTRSHYEMLVDSKSGLMLGEQLRLGRNVFTVVGLTRNQVSSGGDPVAYITLRDAQRLQFELEPPVARREAERGTPQVGTDIVNAVVAKVAPGTTPDRVVEAVGRWKHLAGLSQSAQENILTKSVVDKSRRQIGLFTVILLVVSAVIISLILYTMTMDKVREIATLKLIGAPDKTIIGLIIQEAVAMAVIGFSVGALLINLTRDFFPRRVILLPQDGFALAVVVLVLCVLASGMGVRLALKIEPAVALGG